MTNRPKAIDREAKFDKKRFILSKTDTKGNILSINSEFCDISGYSEKELIGKQHNILRHPNMPKAIFHLMWKYLLSGRAITVVIKNLTKSGEYYWVIADLKPRFNEKGTIVSFTSFQKFATEDIVEEIEELYETMIRIEKVHKIKNSLEYLDGFLEERKVTYDGFIYDLIKPKGIINSILKTFKEMTA
ncbi:Methyl-accepting chemotaxis protein [hydrothermal vent metagenome]|uniref:Methyl-accepting chemotaxis protein n=1 Tax=hydrothermal vent metagenome TaxID=652676 RepID=A0A1W1BS76_9ZZZZ